MIPPEDRRALLARLRACSDWDVVVIGGGATGLGAAVDAVSRGFRTLVVDAHDFAGGTSGKSTKLVHGGVRYLAQRDWHLVREALAERGRLLRNAPHLAWPLGFVVPAYRWSDAPLYGLGLKLYDALAGRERLQHSRWLSRRATLAALPTIAAHGLKGGVLYYDGQFDDARLALALARTVLDRGGLALNYLRAVRLLKDDADSRVAGVELRDAETGERFRLRARCVINAAGVWADAVRRMDDRCAVPRIVPSQGTHRVLPRACLPSDHALLVPRTDDGRVLFVLPWHGRTLVGTTDTPRPELALTGVRGALAHPEPLDAELDFILAAAARYLTRAPRRADVLSAWSGLRPLADDGMHGDGHGGTARLSREHRIEVAASGLVSVTGGKWTTYRRMAEDALDAAIDAKLLEPRPCATQELRLHGAPPDGTPCGAAGSEPSPYGTDEAAWRTLDGAQARLVDALDLTEAQVRYAVRHEFARNVDDVLARRHRALLLDASAALDAAPRVALLMARELGRPAAWIDAQTARFATVAAAYRVPLRDVSPI